MFKRGDRGTIKLHLADEAPRIGSGIRTVEYTIGNRLVTLRNPYTNRKANLPRETFERLAKGKE